MKSGVRAQVNEKKTGPKFHSHYNFRKFRREFPLGDFGKDGVHDARRIAKFGDYFDACSTATRKFCIAIAHIVGAAKHCPNVVLKVTRNVYCEVAARIRYAGHRLPKAFIIGVERYFAIKTFQFPQQHHFNIACSIHASSHRVELTKEMKRKFKFVLPVFFAIPALSAFALPDLLNTYQSDPFAKVKKADCSICHETAQGGGRNAFGDAFADNLHQITPLLRAQFPGYFSFPSLKVNDNLTIHFSDPDNKYVVVESGKKMVEVGVEDKTVDGKKAVAPKE
jgi:hypothetical protein